jgi:hypothetical protein
MGCGRRDGDRSGPAQGGNAVAGDHDRRVRPGCRTDSVDDRDVGNQYGLLRQPWLGTREERVRQE